VSKRPTVLDRAIAAIDKKIAGLQVARLELIEQQAEARSAITRTKTLRDEDRGAAGEESS